MKDDDLQSTLERNRETFRDGHRKLQGYQAKIIIESETTKKFSKARTVPYSMKVKIEEKLDRLVSLGIIQPNYSFRIGQHHLFLSSNQIKM